MPSYCASGALWLFGRFRSFSPRSVLLAGVNGWRRSAWPLARIFLVMAPDSRPPRRYLGRLYGSLRRVAWWYTRGGLRLVRRSRFHREARGACRCSQLRLSDDNVVWANTAAEGSPSREGSLALSVPDPTLRLPGTALPLSLENEPSRRRSGLLQQFVSRTSPPLYPLQLWGETDTARVHYFRLRVRFFRRRGRGVSPIAILLAALKRRLARAGTEIAVAVPALVSEPWGNRRPRAPLVSSDPYRDCLTSIRASSDPPDTEVVAPPILRPPNAHQASSGAAKGRSAGDYPSDRHRIHGARRDESARTSLSASRSVIVMLNLPSHSAWLLTSRLRWHWSLAAGGRDMGGSIEPG